MKVILNLTDYQAHLQTRPGDKYQEVWDPVRKRYVRMTPEELVRQLFIIYLLEERKARLTALSVERQVNVFGQPRRYDLMIHKQDGKPLVLVEVKAPGISINQGALDQIARYNQAFGVSWMIVSNGITTYCMQLNQESGSIQFLDRIPDFITE